MSENPTHSEAVRNEIAELERLLQEKRDALHASGEAKPEKELFHETYKTAFGEPPAPVEGSTSGSVITNQLPQDLAGDLAVVQGSERSQQLSALVQIAMANGIRAAADIARRATPWLLDQLHDTLQDTYYDELVRTGKLKAL